MSVMIFCVFIKNIAGITGGLIKLDMIKHQSLLLVAS